MQIKWEPKTDLEKAGLKAVRLLNNAGFQAFWVGGIVRNILMKRESDNIDIATDATPDQIEETLSKAGINHKPVGKQFGSILAIINKQKVEITTFRAEGRYSDNRHPDQVEFIRDYLQDAKRRDFTINALYFDPVQKFLYDPAKGLEDLRLKLIRFVGDPRKRIDEDALRMLRGVRLAGQLNFKLERNSFAAIKTRAKYLQGISGERIKAELDKILLSADPGRGIELLEQTGLLKYISFELDEQKKVFHNSKVYHLEGDGLRHAILVMKVLKLPDLNLKYAALFHDVGKINTGHKVKKKEGWVTSYHGHVDSSMKIFDQFAKKLKFSRHDTKQVLWLIQHHDEKMKFIKMKMQDQITYASNPWFPLLLDIWQGDINGNITAKENDWYKQPRLAGYKYGQELWVKINSKAILVNKIARGELVQDVLKIKPGPQVGKILSLLRAKIIIGEIENISDAKDFLKNLSKST